MFHTPSLTSTAVLLLVIILLVTVYTQNPGLGGGCTFKTADYLAPKSSEKGDEMIEKPFEPTTYSTENTGGNNQKLDAATLRRVGAEALWSELSESFQKGSDAPTQAVLENTNWRALGLTGDEIDFYRGVRALLERNGQDFSGDDWLRRLRQAGYIYGRVAQVFEKTAAGSVESPEKIFKNANLQTKLTESMQQEFGIEATKIDGFLKKYPQPTAGKWATLIFYLGQ